MAKVFYRDAYILGLLYVYAYSDGTQQMVLLDDLEKFHQTIEDNLKDSNISKKNMYASVFYDNDEPIYFISKNKNNEIYYILKPGIDINEIKYKYIGILPIDVITASKMPNSLEALGLEKVNNTVKVIKKTINKEMR